MKIASSHSRRLFSPCAAASCLLANAPLAAQSDAAWLQTPTALAILVLGLLAVILLIAFIRALGRGDSLAIESHWGGFAGGLGGWRISRALAYGVMLAFVILTIAVVALYSANAAAKSAQNEPQAKAKTEADANAGGSGDAADSTDGEAP